MPPRHAASLADHVRSIIATRGLTAYSVAKAAGVDPSTMTRFVSGERDLSLESFGKVVAALGLRLVESAGGLRSTHAGRPSK
jgi:DNA-binding phage protein